MGLGLILGPTLIHDQLTDAVGVLSGLACPTSRITGTTLGLCGLDLRPSDFDRFMLQRLDGLDMQRLKDIDDYATSPAFSDDDRAAIAYAAAMTTDPHTVTDQQVADLRQRFGDAGVFELTYQIGLENMRARMNTALGITEQGFNSGDACRVPWADDPEAGNR